MNDIIDVDAALLTTIGLIPWIGDFYKDQLQARMSRIEMDRLHDAILRLGIRIGSRPVIPVDPDKRRQLEEFIESICRQVMKQPKGDRRHALVNLIAVAVTGGENLIKLDFTARLLDRVSDLAIYVLVKLQPSQVTRYMQIHSHSGNMELLQNEIGYHNLVSALKELDSLGMLSLDIQYSNFSGEDPRFMVWWRGLGNDFIKYLNSV